MNDILNIISSSSKGNCYIYNKDIMLDIGVSFIKIKEYLKDINLILLTHCHQDHVNKKTLAKVIYEKPTIKIACGIWMVKLLMNLGVPLKNIYVLELNKTYNLGKYIIQPVPAEHDVPNCGYKIIIKKNNYKIFHITDTSNLKNIEAKGYDLFCIENNYTTELLEKHIKDCIENEEDKNKLYYLERAKVTHLSSEECNSFLIENMSENSCFEYIHQSSYNFEERD